MAIYMFEICGDAEPSYSFLPSLPALLQLESLILNTEYHDHPGWATIAAGELLYSNTLTRLWLQGAYREAPVLPQGEEHLLCEVLLRLTKLCDVYIGYGAVRTLECVSLGAVLACLTSLERLKLFADLGHVDGERLGLAHSETTLLKSLDVALNAVIVSSTARSVVGYLARLPGLSEIGFEDLTLAQKP